MNLEDAEERGGGSRIPCLSTKRHSQGGTLEFLPFGRRHPDGLPDAVQVCPAHVATHPPAKPDLLHALGQDVQQEPADENGGRQREDHVEVRSRVADLGRTASYP